MPQPRPVPITVADLLNELIKLENLGYKRLPISITFIDNINDRELDFYPAIAIQRRTLRNREVVVLGYIED